MSVSHRRQTRARFLRAGTGCKYAMIYHERNFENVIRVVCCDPVFWGGMSCAKIFFNGVPAHGMGY